MATVLIGQLGPGAATANNNGAGTAFAQKYTAGLSGTVTSLNIRTGATGPAAGNLRAALYADNAGTVAGAARLSGDITGNFAANTIVSFVVSPGVVVVSGTAYWIEWVSIATGIDYTNFAASGGTELDTSGLTTLATPHPATTGPNANIANVWAEGDTGAPLMLSPQSIPFMR